MEKSDSIYDEPVEEVVWVREGLYDLTVRPYPRVWPS